LLWAVCRLAHTAYSTCEQQHSTGTASRGQQQGMAVGGALQSVHSHGSGSMSWHCEAVKQCAGRGRCRQLLMMHVLLWVANCRHGTGVCRALCLGPQLCKACTPQTTATSNSVTAAPGCGRWRLQLPA
jgi:hypothetical protein